jgi:hypothetical protein
MRKSLRTMAWLTVASIGTAVPAQETSMETGPDGVTYRVTRQVVQRTIPTTEYQTRQQEVYRPQVTTNYHSYQQTTLAPVTEYQWVPRLEGRWNPFIQPYWTHQLGSAPDNRERARSAHRLGQRNSHDASASHHLSHRAGRVHQQGCRKRYSKQYNCHCQRAHRKPAAAKRSAARGKPVGQ